MGAPMDPSDLIRERTIDTTEIQSPNRNKILKINFRSL